MDELEKIREMKREEMLRSISPPTEPVKITDEGFVNLLAKHPLLVVDCWAPWCMPCRMIGPIVDELSKEYAGKVVFGKLNLDENRVIAQRLEIMSIPTLLFFREGKLVDRLIGALPKEQIKFRVEKLQQDGR